MACSRHGSRSAARVRRVSSCGERLRHGGHRSPQTAHTHASRDTTASSLRAATRSASGPCGVCGAKKYKLSASIPTQRADAHSTTPPLSGSLRQQTTLWSLHHTTLATSRVSTPPAHEQRLGLHLKPLNRKACESLLERLGVPLVALVPNRAAPVRRVPRLELALIGAGACRPAPRRQRQRSLRRAS